MGLRVIRRRICLPQSLQSVCQSTVAAELSVGFFPAFTLDLRSYVTVTEKISMWLWLGSNLRFINSKG